MSDAFLSSAIMLLALALFLSDRIRPDAVALIVLMLAWVTGLVSLEEALAGFGSPAVIIVAAVLVVGRAVEFTGAAQAMTGLFVPKVPFATVRIGGVLLMGAVLSAFMNNIAALAITMPIALNVAREHNLPNGAVLMPLSFATILGGMTTLIGTPANLIISSIREDTVGEPFGMFDMTPVGGALAVAGLLYLMVVGWRLAPRREGGDEEDDSKRVLVFELGLPIAASQGQMRMDAMRRKLRESGAVLLAVLRNGHRTRLESDAMLFHDDRLLVMSRDYPWEVAERSGLFSDAPPERPDAVTAHVSVIHGSSLIGQDYGAVGAHSGGAIEFIAAGPRAARMKRPLQANQIEPGEQLFLRGEPDAMGRLIRHARLLEVDRDAAPIKPGRSAALVVAIYALAVLVATFFGIETTAAFIAAALAICLLRLIPADEAYRAIDIPVLILLAGMIPVGRAFDEAGGSSAIAGVLGWMLSGAPLFVTLAVIVGVTMLLTIFLNNIATALVMAQVGVGAAAALGISPDAALLAVLIGSSCDFLTPIGHQNNLIVMRPGNYRFRDYPKVGLPLSILAILVSAYVLSRLYG
ncbi:SLC13 family permease [Sphingosinicella sp. CPCC 101087]|uniref:SLC13 family permease n=1 Tax=Sphingosinicella sp. CPCC 101087 TaxID=2497754 RepID=UPI00101D77E5|nr:SLC13 family permease [Sphingosinicella sp. CPCC 101087]